MDRRSSCPHVSSDSLGLEELCAVRKAEGTCSTTLIEDAHCQVCKFSNRNLWLCLHSKCGTVYCGGSHKDHSSDHYQEFTLHCLHLNLTSMRIWCYECNSEVYPLNNQPPLNRPVAMLFVKNDEPFSDNMMKSEFPLGIVGLHNLGNTCYMNAALQALSNVQPMTQYFLECMPPADKDKEMKKTSLSRAYKNLLHRIWSEQPPASLSPTCVFYAIKLAFQMFRGYQQHDSQEFLRCFMDQLHEELKEPIDELRKETGTKQESDEESEQSESESYLTCDSGVSDDEGSTTSNSSATLINSISSSRKRTRSVSENEFSDALDRSPSPRHTSMEVSPSTQKFRSIVSDVFDGRILSCVECLTCNLISSRVETFQDLSLPIPSRDQLYVIHQSVPQAVTQTDNQGWISWMWNAVWGWFWGPSGRLNDCLSAFFSADELKGDNMYSCEKCKKLRNGVKFSSIIELPEVLTIHLKRFRHEPMFSSKISSHIGFPIKGLDMKPWVSRDCTSKTTIYDLTAVIVHHGTAGGGHYTCYALNEPTEQWIEFDDSSTRPVSVETVANCQAYVLFYRKRRTKEIEDFSRHYGKLTEQGVDAQAAGDGLFKFYVSKQWFSKFKTFAEPGPIHNRDFLCPHGGVHPLKIEHLDDACVAVTASVWEALYTRFGGGPACNRLYTCSICQHAQEMMDKRRKEELETFLELQRDFQDEKSSVPLYAISMSWFRKWEQFVKNRESPLPGPVDNLPITILRNGNRILRPSSDFAQLSAALWHLFYSRYGGGPEVIIRA